MVAFAGRKYAARSLPTLVADDSNTITSFTLVHPFNHAQPLSLSLSLIAALS